MPARTIEQIVNVEIEKDKAEREFGQLTEINQGLRAISGRQKLPSAQKNAPH